MSTESNRELAQRVAVIDTTRGQPPAEVPPPRRRQVFVSRRTCEGLQPRAPQVPTTAEHSLALRKAVLKRRRKAERRRAEQLAAGRVLFVPGDVDLGSAPMAPGMVQVIDDENAPAFTGPRGDT